MKPVFKNRKNQPIETLGGETIWNSRSCAVVAQICLYNQSDSNWYVLLGKRGSGTPDFQGFWGLPCGYLDWDESLCEAVIREVWEECGLFLPSLSSHPNFLHSDSSMVFSPPFSDVPWNITDRTDNVKQNISMHYAVLVGWSGMLPDLSNAFADPGEVDGLEWVPIQQSFDMDLAFNHQQRIRKLWDDQASLFRQLEARLR